MNRYTIHIYFLFALMQFGCTEDFLEQTPDHVISEELVVSSVDKLNRLLTGSYNEITEGNYLGRILYKRAAVKSADFRFVQTIYNPRNYEQIEYRYEESANNNGGAADLWLQCYKIIGNLNLILENIDAAEGDDGLRRQVKAQSFALRGMVYFDLARTYAYPWITAGGASQGLPLKLNSSELVISRSTLGETYEQIIADLSAAEALIAEDTFEAGSTKYITKTAVWALKARVFLYRQDWQKALEQAQNVLTIMPESKLMVPNNYTFNDYNSESIFELSVGEDNSAGSNGLGAQFDYRQGGQGDVVATKTFVNLLSEYEGDPRAALLATSKEGYREAFVKYVNRSGGAGLSIHNIPVIRLSEIYLIAAEACANGAAAGEKQARTYLNTLIARRTQNFQKYKSLETGAALLDRIYKERRRELALEGHEVYDLIRTGRAITRPQADHVNTGLNSTNLSIAADSPKTIYPIPASEVSASGMQQTQGY